MLRPTDNECAFPSSRHLVLVQAEITNRAVAAPYTRHCRRFDGCLLPSATVTGVAIGSFGSAMTTDHSMAVRAWGFGYSQKYSSFLQKEVDTLLCH